MTEVRDIDNQKAGTVSLVVFDLQEVESASIEVRKKNVLISLLAYAQKNGLK